VDGCVASLSSFPGANGGLDAAVRYVRTHHDVTFHATVPYESASHQPRPSERVRTAAYDALEACGCSVQPGSVSVIEKHRGDGVWAVTVRCEGGEEALSLREALFPGDQRKPSRAERGFTDSLREGGGDRLVASDWATLSDQSPDPSTFGVVFSFLVACCLGSSTVDGAGVSFVTRLECECGAISHLIQSHAVGPKSIYGRLHCRLHKCDHKLIWDAISHKLPSFCLGSADTSWIHGVAVKLF
jgi:hypothetical protein